MNEKKVRMNEVILWRFVRDIPVRLVKAKGEIVGLSPAPCNFKLVYLWIDRNRKKCIHKALLYIQSSVKPTQQVISRF